jgi:hypothetical protein
MKFTEFPLLGILFLVTKMVFAGERPVCLYTKTCENLPFFQAAGRSILEDESSQADNLTCPPTKMFLAMRTESEHITYENMIMPFARIRSSGFI